jgi:hypothetical protein
MSTGSDALQMHCTENSKQIFPEIKLHGIFPNFCIHLSVSDLYIPTICPQTQYCKIDRPMDGKLNITHRYINVESENKAAQFISGNICCKILIQCSGRSP